MFLPLALTAYYSLSDYSGFGRVRLTGLENYREIATDPLFWRSLLSIS